MDPNPVSVIGLGPLAAILQHTPSWVWLLLAGLVFLGWVQSRDRTAGLVAVSAAPLAMTLFSLWGTTSAFARSPLLAPVLAGWLLVAAIVTASVARGPARAWYDRATRRFELAGSWVPLLLFVGIFLVRYTVSVQLVLHPALVHDATFALLVAAVSGAFSGLFLGRAARLWRLALGPRLSWSA